MRENAIKPGLRVKLIRLHHLILHDGIPHRHNGVMVLDDDSHNQNTKHLRRNLFYTASLNRRILLGQLNPGCYYHSFYISTKGYS